MAALAGCALTCAGAMTLLDVEPSWPSEWPWSASSSDEGAGTRSASSTSIKPPAGLAAVDDGAEPDERDEPVAASEWFDLTMLDTAGLDEAAAAPVPHRFGDDPVLDALYLACDGGDGAACDQLFIDSPVGSDYELFGVSCGDRPDILDCTAELDG